MKEIFSLKTLLNEEKQTRKPFVLLQRPHKSIDGTKSASSAIQSTKTDNA